MLAAAGCSKQTVKAERVMSVADLTDSFWTPYINSNHRHRCVDSFYKMTLYGRKTIIWTNTLQVNFLYFFTQTPQNLPQ